jgi:hypothetical protein
VLALPIHQDLSASQLSHMAECLAAVHVDAAA